MEPSSVAKDEDETVKKNVWARKVDCENSLIVPCRNITSDNLASVLLNRCVYTISTGKQRNMMLGLYGKVFVTVGHAFPESETSWRITVHRGDQDSPVKERYECILTKENILRRDGDLVYIRHEAFRPTRDIRKFIKNYYPTGRGLMVTKQREIASIMRFVPVKDQYFVGETEYHTDVRILTSEGRTSIGTCGSPAVCTRPDGNYIYGIVVSTHGDFDSCKHGVKMLSTAVIDSLPEDFSDTGMHFAPSCEFVSIPLHESSPLRHYSLDTNLVPIGSISAPRKHFKSETTRSLIYQDLVDHLGEIPEYGAPKMRGGFHEGVYKHPMIHAAAKRGKNKSIRDPEIMKQCADAVENDLASQINLKSITLLSVDDAVNGIPGKRFVDKLPRNTSAGLDLVGKKSAHMTEPDEDQRVSLLPQIVEAMDDLKARYMRFERGGVVFDGCLKDEALPISKIESFKTRFFTSVSMYFIILQKMVYGHLCAALMENNIGTGIGAGLNCYSDWEALYVFLNKFGTFIDRCIAGDFSGFDCEMCAIRMFLGLSVCRNLLIRSGNFSQEWLQIAAGLNNDLIHPFVNFNGDIAQIYGSNCSGHFLTLILNCVVNMIDMRYAFVIGTGLPASSFNKFVAANFTGDDNIMAVRYPIRFDHTLIQKILGDVGITYTMADKTSDSVPYVRGDSVEYLKRTFSVIQDKVVAPLSKDSLIKSLSTVTKSKVLCEEEQMAQIIEVANREYSLHGKETYDKMHDIFVDIIDRTPELRVYIPPRFWFGWQETFDSVVSGNCFDDDIFEPEEFLPSSELCQWYEAPSSLPPFPYFVFTLAVLISPLNEELFKRRFWWAPIVLPLYESVFVHFDTPLHAFFRAAAHVWWSKLSLLNGTWMHLAWNVFVLYVVTAMYSLSGNYYPYYFSVIVVSLSCGLHSWQPWFDMCSKLWSFDLWSAIHAAKTIQTEEFVVNGPFFSTFHYISEVGKIRMVLSANNDRDYCQYQNSIAPSCEREWDLCFQRAHQIFDDEIRTVLSIQRELRSVVSNFSPGLRAVYLESVDNPDFENSDFWFGVLSTVYYMDRDAQYTPSELRLMHISNAQEYMEPEESETFQPSSETIDFTSFDRYEEPEEWSVAFHTIHESDNGSGVYVTEYSAPYLPEGEIINDGESIIPLASPAQLFAEVIVDDMIVAETFANFPFGLRFPRLEERGLTIHSTLDWAVYHSENFYDSEFPDFMQDVAYFASLHHPLQWIEQQTLIDVGNFLDEFPEGFEWYIVESFRDMWRSLEDRSQIAAEFFMLRMTTFLILRSVKLQWGACKQMSFSRLFYRAHAYHC
jgi:hypothetical protein